MIAIKRDYLLTEAQIAMSNNEFGKQTFAAAQDFQLDINSRNPLQRRDGRFGQYFIKEYCRVSSYAIWAQGK